MIPKNNREKFIGKYGNWWYLRDLDLMPENLADCGYNITIERMRTVMKTPRQWAVYDNYGEAVEASIKARMELGLEDSKGCWYPSEKDMTYKF